jgi:hypothetical protein
MSEWRRPAKRWDRLEQDLLRAGRRDAPPLGARKKALIALAGIGAGALESTTAAGHASALASTIATGSKLAMVAGIKWVALGVLGAGAIAAAGYVGATGRSPMARGPVAPSADVASLGSYIETKPQVAPVASGGDLPVPTTTASPRVPFVGVEASFSSSPAQPLPATTRVEPPNVARSVRPPDSQFRREHEGAEPSTFIAPPVANSAPSIPPTEDGVPTTEPTMASSPGVFAGDKPLPAPTPSESSAPPGLADEVSMLEAARKALRERDPTRAEQELDHYATAFRSGILKPESIALRIEAKLARGERTEAAALGRRFLEVYPKHTLAPRIRVLVGL